MTQEQALEKARELFPEFAQFIRVERSRGIGFTHGHDNQFFIWDHSDRWDSRIVADSTQSWEHLLATAEENERRRRADEKLEAMPTVDSPFEDEVA